MKTPREAIKLIEDIEGKDSLDIVEDAIMDSTIVGICMNNDCEFTAEYEHDQNKGFCEDCETGSVESLMLLLVLI